MSSCPVCHTSSGLAVSFERKCFRHFCPRLKKVVYWRKNVFSTDPDRLPAA